MELLYAIIAMLLAITISDILYTRKSTVDFYSNIYGMYYFFSTIF